MAYVINDPVQIYIPASRGHMAPSGNGLTNGVFRLPTDPVFYADFTLTNLVTGSSYWVAQASDLTNVLGSGTAGSSTVVISGMASYDAPQMLVTIRIRKAGYVAFETQAYHQKTGAGSYIIQTVDSNY